MRYLSTLAAALAAAVCVHGQPPLPVVPPIPPGPPKVTIGKRPESPKPHSHQALVGELVRVQSGSSSARWEIAPSSDLVDLQPDGKGNATVSATDAGIYFAVCYDGNEPAAWVMIEFAHRVRPGPNPPGPNPPGPNPPGPGPAPVGSVKRFVVVEDTRKAAPFRGQIMGSPALAAFYKSAGLSHRLIDVAAPEAADEEAAKYLALAASVPPLELPYLWTFDAAGTQISAGKAPLTAEAFVEALGAGKPPAPHKRALGNRPPPKGLVKAWKSFGETPTTPLIPRKDWKEVDLSAFLPDVKDQDGVGACNAFAAVTVAEAARYQQGLPYRRLSPGYLYGNINNQRDDGSLLEDGMRFLETNGTCLASTVGELDWQRSRWPAAKAAAEAQNFVALEVYLCPSFDAVASALQQGFFIVEGLAWYDNFTTDADGWLPSRGRGNWGGHALAGYGLTKRGNAWGIKTRNSWSESWGKNGNCVIPESLFDSRIGGYWAIRSMKQVAGPVTVGLDPFRREVVTMAPAPNRAGRPGFEFALAP